MHNIFNSKDGTPEDAAVAHSGTSRRDFLSAAGALVVSVASGGFANQSMAQSAGAAGAAAAGAVAGAAASAGLASAAGAVTAAGAVCAVATEAAPNTPQPRLRPKAKVASSFFIF